MKETFTDEKRLRCYLLDDLPEDEQLAIGERLLTDPAYLEQLQIVEEDLIDDYLRDKLSPRDRLRFRQQFNTPARRHKIQLASAFRDYINTLPSAEEPAPSLLRRLQEMLTQFVSPPVLRAATAVLVLTFGAGVLWLMMRPSDARQGVNALEDAYSAARPLEARISGFPYARFYGAREQSSARINTAKLQLADQVFEKLASKKSSAETQYALGKYHLAEGRFDEAIGHLNIALAAQPREALLRVDLAAAWLEKGKAELNNQQRANAEAAFARSRDYLNQALEQQPNLPDALFNLALLHHTRQAWPEAVTAWRLYLEKDPNSPWVQEAKHYLEQAETRAQQ
jgi:tetratricopeptide (TPR) repeat protein